MKIVYGTWTKKNDELYLVLYDRQNKVHLIKPPFDPHFFIREKDLPKVKKILLKKTIKSIEKTDYLTADKKEPVVQINFYFPSDVNSVRAALESSGIPTYESDIPFIRNVILHWNYLEIEDKPTRIWFDIETDSRKGIANPIVGEQRILSLGFVTKNSEYFYSAESEKDTLLDFFKDAKKYNLWLGWNSDKFDIPYILARCNNLGIKTNMTPSQTLDLMYIFAREILFKEPRTTKLDYWAKKILGRGKTIPELHPNTLWELFMKNKEELKTYNITDCELARDIDLALNISRYRIQIAKIAKVFYEQTGRMVYDKKKKTWKQSGGKNIIVDNMILMEASERSPRLVFPKKREHKKMHKVGAYIHKPSPGLHENCLYLDYKSLYPSIVLTFNIGYDTFLPSCTSDAIKTVKGCFAREPRSLFATSLIKLMHLRDELKAKLKQLEPNTVEYAETYAKQYAVKVIMNSYIGVMGHEFSRFFNPTVFESVTTMARWITKKSIEIMENMGIQVIYGDTDSVFIKTTNKAKPETFVDLINNKLRKEIIETFNVPEEYYSIKIKIDEEFDKVYFLAKKQKKRYFGWTKENRKPNLLNPQEYFIGGRLTKVVGVDLVRRDTFNLLVCVQKKVIEIILSAEPERFKETVIPKLEQFLAKTRQYLYAGLLDRLLIYTTGTKLDPSKYKANQPHIKAIKKLYEKGMYLPGEVVQYVITGYDSDGTLDAEPVINGKIPPISLDGYNYYWERIQRMIENVLGFRVSGSAGYTGLEFFLNGGEK